MATERIRIARPRPQDYYIIANPQITGPTRTVRVRLVFDWRARTGRWAVQMQAPDATPLSIWQDVAPSARLLFDVRDPRCPEGEIAITGPDPYTRTDLGGRLEFQFRPVASS